jgi:ubiquitin-protein ligase E3 A
MKMVEFAARLNHPQAVGPFLTRSLETLTRTSLFSFQSIRHFLLLWYFPGILQDAPWLYRLCQYLQNPPILVRYVLEQWLMFLPRLLERMAAACQTAILQFFRNSPRTDPRGPEIFGLYTSVGTLYGANGLASHRLPISIFYCKEVNDRINVEQELLVRSRSFRDCPFLISLEVKAKFCHVESKHMMEAMAQRAIEEGVITALLRRSREIIAMPYLILRVRRAELLRDSIEELSTKPRWDYLKKLRVIFDGEEGKDAGGISREFLYLLSEQLFSPDFGMFKVVENRHLWFSGTIFQDLRMFFLCGAVVSLAVYNSIVLPIRFPLLLYKKLLSPRKPLTLADLAEIDNEAAESLRQIEMMKLRCEDVSDLCLTFSAGIDDLGQRRTIPFVPNGENVPVTNENCQDYIHEYLKYFLYTAIKPCFDEFSKGFGLSLQANSYQLLDPSEMDLLVSGEETIDWSKLPSVTLYDGYPPVALAIKWFWEIFFALSDAEKKEFLKFSCGTDRVPWGGITHIRLIIQRLPPSNDLPSSHTCFNIFSLPEYSSKTVMEAKIKVAIQFTEGFGME